jgi:hypothetical protein
MSLSEYNSYYNLWQAAGLWSLWRSFWVEFSSKSWKFSLVEKLIYSIIKIAILSCIQGKGMLRTKSLIFITRPVFDWIFHRKINIGTKENYKRPKYEGCLVPGPACRCKSSHVLAPKQMWYRDYTCLTLRHTRYKLKTKWMAQKLSNCDNKWK